MATLSVVVPVYNASASLPELVRRLGEVLPSCADSYELILVNDASVDESWRVIERLSATHQWVQGIDLARNYGQHNALLCGVRAATGHVVVTLDDDLQHPPEEIPRLLAKLEEGVDVVYGTPREERHGLWRVIASHISKVVLQETMGAETARAISAFRAFRREAACAFDAVHNPFVNVDVLLSWGARSFAAVAVRHDERRAGQSNYTLRKLVRHGLNMLTGFSSLPLRVASLVGFGVMLFGVGVLVWVIGRYVIQGGSVPGFPFLASVITIFAGAQLFSLGIMGEYLARIHYRSIDRPAYLVRARTGARPEAPR